MVKEVSRSYLLFKAVKIEQEFLSKYGFSYSRNVIYKFLKNSIVGSCDKVESTTIDTDRMKSIYGELKKQIYHRRVRKPRK